MQFSFRSDASYEPLVLGPALKPRKPSVIPELEFNDLPVYVTTTEEDQDEDREDEESEILGGAPDICHGVVGSDLLPNADAGNVEVY